MSKRTITQKQFTELCSARNKLCGFCEAVHNNVIDIANYPDANTHIHYACKESFEKIKQKIKEAI